MNLSVKQRLVGNALLAIATTLVVGVAGYGGIFQLDDAMDRIVGDAKALRQQMDADMRHDTLRSDVYVALFQGSQGSQNDRDKLAAAARKHGEELLKAVQAAGENSSEDVQRLVAQAKPDLERYSALSIEMVGLAYSDYARAKERLPEFVAAFDKLETEMERISDQIEKAVERSQQGGDRSVGLLKIVIVTVSLAAAAALLAISFLLARGILLPLDNALRAANAVAAGDLTVSVEAGGQDEVGRLLAALKKMKDDLGESMRSIQVAADNVNTGSKEIARGNADLSSRTEEQASSLEETASSMEELTTTVKQNAESARQANQLAIGAADVAGQGGEAVREVVQTMSGISDASRKIADIITVIDGIAFQTNILALNAAVEAARAGEQGRGFAVVAAEVRALAQRSAGAAKEIKALIEDSVSRVNEGARQVDDAGRTMEEIVTSVKRVTDIVSEISAASEEQLRGIEQVSQAVMQMDKVVQQNAALVEESAAAAESLSGQAETMAATVGRFKLEAAEHKSRAAARKEPVTAPAASPARRLHTPRPEAPRIERRKPAAAAVKPTPPQIAAIRPKPKGDDGDWKEF
jgi:methyl-accepting chemotaxis protein